MKLLMVCSEFAPLAKTGGLADAVTGLSHALAERGHDVRVLLPKYAELQARGKTLTAPARLADRASHRYSAADVGKGERAKVYLLDLEELTADGVYTGDARDAGRFLSLCSAAAALPDALGWRPDVVHCHDWHAALAPAFFGASPDAPATVLTLHNVGYQGVFPRSVLAESGAADVEEHLAPDAFADGYVNFLRAGLRAATRITTVSPTYAAEILTPEFGMGLEDILQERSADLVGILNGVDYSVWGPKNDPYIEHYAADDLSPKYRLKGSLSSRLGLVPDQNAPLVGAVSRLATQKGLDLVVAALPRLLAETRANFAFLGSGDTDLASALHRLATEHPRRVSFTEGYDEPLSHRILAGSDFTLVPSRYEPCGLTQMYALAYGTIPVVRATGGLADTVRHFDPVSGLGNGSVFRDANTEGFLWGLRTALSWFDDPPAWSRVVANAMTADFSWASRVSDYERLYAALA